MSKAGSQQGVLHKLVFELRYDYGYTYLDRAGSTINDILRSNAGWIPEGVNPQQGVLKHIDSEAIFTFGPRKLVLSQQQSEKIATLMPLPDFAEMANKLARTVRGWLQLAEEERDFTRVGFRVWRLFEQESLESAKKAIRSMGILSEQHFASLADVRSVDEVSFNVTIDRPVCKTRIAVAAVEQSIQVDPATVKQALQIPHEFSHDQVEKLREKIKAKKCLQQYPQFAVLVDMDHFVDDPDYPEHLDIVSDFIVPSDEWGAKVAVELVRRS